MARKKKEEVIQPEVQEEQVTQTTGTIGYQGTVKISIQQNRKIISTKTYHNSGCIQLFKFMCNALAGVFDEPNRPQKIMLFSGENSDYTTTTSLTPYILNDTTPVVAKVTAADSSTYYTTTYHFRIPYSYLNASNAQEKKIKIYKAALYGNVSSTSSPETDNQCANYKLGHTDSAGTFIWDPIEIDTSITGNFSVIIEWTMTIKNI